ncbi:MAG: hypothetical protein ABIA21_00290 [Candidatus Aenigmatarchaeota archaeon]
MMTQGLLTHRTEEELFHETYSYQTDDPYIISLELENFAHSLGAVYEKVNKIMTSGPRRHSIISFSIIKEMDKFTKLSLIVHLIGETKSVTNLDMEITSVLQSRIPPGFGFMERSFHDYYMKHIIPVSRDILKTESDHIRDSLLRKLEKMATQMTI